MTQKVLRRTRRSPAGHRAIHASGSRRRSPQSSVLRLSSRNFHHSQCLSCSARTIASQLAVVHNTFLLRRLHHPAPPVCSHNGNAKDEIGGTMLLLTEYQASQPFGPNRPKKSHSSFA